MKTTMLKKSAKIQRRHEQTSRQPGFWRNFGRLLVRRHVIMAVALIVTLGIVRSSLPVTSAPITSGAIQKLTVYQGVAIIAPSGTTDFLELGNAGRDIASTGDIYLRPGSVPGSPGSGAASYARFFNSNNLTALTVPGNVGIGTGTATPRGLLHVASSASFDDLVVNSEATTNLVANPSFEVSTSGWSPTPKATGTRDSATSVYGSYSAKTVFSVAAGDGWRYDFSAGISASTTYTLSGYFKTADTDCSLLFVWDTGGPQQGSSVAITDTSNTWVRYSTTFTTSADATGVGYIDAPRCSGSQTLYVDAVQLEQKSYATPYADGSLGPGYSWSGTEHNSSSSRTAGAIFAYQTINSAKGLGTAGNAYIGGNVGIGTTSPGGYKLAVAGTAIVKSDTFSGDALIVGNDSKLVDVDLGNTLGIYGIQDSAQGHIKLGSAGPVSPTISGVAGNVGINQTAPGAKLAVNNYVAPPSPARVGSSGDAVYGFADSANAAISGEQIGTGWAGYFSGNVKVAGNFEVTGTCTGCGDKITFSRTIPSDGTAAGAFADIGTINNGNLPIYAKIKIWHHSTGALYYNEFSVSSVFYTGANTDWVEVPPTTVRSWAGDGRKSVTVDARFAEIVGQPGVGRGLELRVRRTEETAGAATAVNGELETNSTFTASSAEGIGATVATGYLGQHGWFFPATANRFEATTQGLFITPGGNVGIGTTGPGSLLDIRYLTATTNDDINALTLQHQRNTASSGGSEKLGILFKQNDNTGASTMFNAARIYSLVEDASPNGGYGLRFQTKNNGASLADVMSLTRTGNVGIARIAPGAKLTVNNPPDALGEGGSSGDAIYAYADSGNAAISGKQANATGWAGYFSGKVNITSAVGLCFGETDCRSTWVGLGGGGGWTEDAGANKIYTTNTGRNVGIGTTGPVVKLDVGPLGGAQTATSGAGGLIRNNAAADTSPYTQPRMIVYGGAGVDTTNWAYFGYGADAQLREVYSKTSSAASKLWGTTSASDGTGAFTQTMSLSAAGNLNTLGTLTVQGTGNSSIAGKVGIGTEGPGAKLHVANGAEGTPDGNADLWVGDTGLAMIGAEGTTAGVKAYLWAGSDGIVGGVAGTLSNHNFYIRTNNVNRMVVDTSGNVGIGTINPNSKLHVAGVVQAQNLYVQGDAVTTVVRTTRTDNTQQGLLRSNGWGDFTFDRSLGVGYDLAGGSFGAGNLYVSGNVGIGTAGPDTKLHVIGAVCAEASDTGCAPASGYVRGNVGLCIGADCRTAWPAGGGTPGLDAVLAQGNVSTRSAGLGTDWTPAAKLVVNNGMAGGFDCAGLPCVGSATDALAAYANTTSSAVYAQQNNAGVNAYAGYFSGRVRISGSESNTFNTVASITGSGFSGGTVLDVSASGVTGTPSYALLATGASGASGTARYAGYFTGRTAFVGAGGNPLSVAKQPVAGGAMYEVPGFYEQVSPGQGANPASCSTICGSLDQCLFALAWEGASGKSSLPTIKTCAQSTISATAILECFCKAS